MNVSIILKITEFDSEWLEKVFAASWSSMCTNGVRGYFPSFCFSRFFNKILKIGGSLKLWKGRTKWYRCPI